MTNRLALFASGAGSNVSKIIGFFNNHSSISVALIVCNNPEAGVINIAKSNNIPVLLISGKMKEDAQHLITQLRQHHIHWIILAGFLRKIPAELIAAFPNKIINIHPALLPKYGGKGMYGHYVHEAVVKNKETQTGITIHLVDEQYDNGKILYQESCEVKSTDSPADVASRVLAIEHKNFARVIEETIAQAQKAS